MSNKRRYHFIEVIIQWEGRVNATHLVNYFNISRTIASKVINSYLTLYPESLIYDDSRKGHLPTVDFIPHYSQGLFSEYQHLSASDQHQAIMVIDQIMLPTREPSPELARPILRAINEHLAIDIGYLSLANPDYLDRIIEPHALIFDGLRWHVRAFCHKNQDFRDFVLSRFNGELIDESKATKTAADDALWNTPLEVVITPDPRLTPLQKRVIELDYRMTEGTCTIPTTAALVNYLLKRLHLDGYHTLAEAQQIILTPECQKRISPYLPKPV